MSRFLLTVALLLTFLPLPAKAYVTPEEILIENTHSARFFDPPPSTRETQAIAAEQAAESAARRKAEQEAILGNGLPASETDDEESDTLHEAAPAPEESGDMQAILQALQELQAQEKTPDEIRNDRILQRIEVQQTQMRYNAERATLPSSLWGADESLHSGAPLADTGAGVVVAVLAILGAVVLVIRRAWRAERGRSW